LSEIEFDHLFGDDGRDAGPVAGMGFVCSVVLCSAAVDRAPVWRAYVCGAPMRRASDAPGFIASLSGEPGSCAVGSGPYGFYVAGSGVRGGPVCRGPACYAPACWGLLRCAPLRGRGRCVPGSGGRIAVFGTTGRIGGKPVRFLWRRRVGEGDPCPAM